MWISEESKASEVFAREKSKLDIDLRQALDSKTVPQLKDIARRLKVRNYSSSPKADLIKQILATPHGRVRSELGLTYLQRYGKTILLFSAVIGPIVAFLAWQFPARSEADSHRVDFSSTNNASAPTNVRQEQNVDIAFQKPSQDDPARLIGPAPPPPESFPNIESSGLKLLTDAGRKKRAYKKSILYVRNNTTIPIRVTLSFIPRDKLPEDASRYKHFDTRPISPGEQLEREMKDFGGPVHLSVFAIGEWHAMNRWFDLKVVPKRRIDVTQNNDHFSCEVEFPE